MAKNKKAQANRYRNLFVAIEEIVEKATNSQLDNAFYESAKDALQHLGKHLRLSPIQTTLLCLFVDQYHRSRIGLDSIASHLNCRPIRLLGLNNEIDTLVAMGYIRCKYNGGDTYYHVPKEVIDALKDNRAYEKKTIVITDVCELLREYSLLVDQVDNDEISHEDLCVEVDALLEQIPNSVFARKLKSYNLSSTERCIFIRVAQLFFEDDDEQVGSYDLGKLFPNGNIPHFIRRDLRKQQLGLFDHKLIEAAHENGLKSTEYVKLTDFAKSEILTELVPPEKGESKHLLYPSKLTAKELIYNAHEAEQIQELASILGEQRFGEVQARLKDSGMRAGFCCLFYGSPGTGKTETVYQLAKQTGRAIFSINVEQIKSKWVGESEQNIKGAFVQYRKLCEHERLAPILLFNEADSIFGVRMENAQHAVDKMNNSIQNIILQEMESFEGILIATTNLTSNLDKAFERRFLYKIEFHRPDPSARTQIWQTMLKGLSQGDAEILATEFDFSGGQIENIVRKHAVQAILSGSDVLQLDSLRTACRQESLNKQRHARIGF